MRSVLCIAVIAALAAGAGCGSGSSTGATQTAATPTFSPAPGTYTAAQVVTLGCATPGAAVHYTTDGSTPTAASTVYVGPIVVSSTTTINAVALASGYSVSAVATGTYTIQLPPRAATPTFSPAPGTFTAPQAVALSCATAGATIHYTTDGSAPTVASPAYVAPITLSSTITINALAVATGYRESAVATGTYTIEMPNRAATPTFSPPPGTFATPIDVTLSSATPGAAIHYTTDGSLPDADSPLFDQRVTVYDTTTIRAIAMAAGFNVSGVATGTYTIDIPNRVATPVLSPPPGTYPSPQVVTMSCETPGARIFYSWFFPYVGPITVLTTTTIEAYAVAPGYNGSKSASGTYTIEEPGTCTLGTTQACYSGPSSTRGIGMCQDGLQSCVAGHWGPCEGERPPMEEWCDSRDNDCSGIADDAGAFGDRNSNLSCAEALLDIPFLPITLPGDAGAERATFETYSETWLSARFTEDSSVLRDVTGTITLYSPFGCDFDLFVYCGSCGGALVGSSELSSGTDVVHVRRPDSAATDDSFTVVIEVRFKWCGPGAQPGSESCGHWKLEVAGNTAAAAGAPICNE